MDPTQNASINLPLHISNVVRDSRMQWLLLAFLLLLLAAALVVNSAFDHKQNIESERHKLQLQLGNLAASLNRQVVRIERVLEALEHHRRVASYRSDSLPSPTYLETLTLGMMGVRSVNVADARGVILASSHQTLVGHSIALPATAESLQHLHPDSARMLHIISPPEAVHNHAAISVMRILRDDSGNIAGAVFANLDRTVFHEQVKAAIYADDMWATVTLENGVPVSYMMGEANDGGPQAVARGELDPDDTELASDLYIELGRDHDMIQAQWRAEIARRLVFFVAFCLVACGALWLFQRRQMEAENQIQSALAALRNSEEGFRLIVEHTLDAVVRISVEGRYTYANPAYCRLVGLPASRLVGRPIWSDIESTDRDGAFDRLQALLLPPHFMSFTQKHHTARGVRHIEWVAQGIRNRNDAMIGIIAVGSDVTKQIQAAEALKAEAERDFLTALGNRRHFDLGAAAEFEQARKVGRPMSVIILDLDRFKSINDTHGHPAGDAVLQQVALRLQNGLRQGDTVSRIGGEEFAILMPAASEDAALEAGERLRRLIEESPVVLADGQRLSVTASVGIASLCDADPTVKHLVQRADKALYRAKAAGRNRVLMSETA